MLRKLLISICLSSITFGSLNAQAAIDPNIKNYEKQNIVFDNRDWQAASGVETPTLTRVEYVVNGEDINQWHELITSQVFPQNQLTPQQFADLFIEGLKGYQATSHFIQQTSDQVVFEWKVASPEADKQDELLMIRRGSNGLYLLHYAMKETDMGEVNRDIWVKNLEASTIKN